MKKYHLITLLATAVVILGLAFQPAFAEQGLRLGGHVGRIQPPQADFDENLIGANKKLLFDATLTHYINTLKVSQVALQNAVALSNRQNNDAQFTSHLAQLRTLNAGLGVAANAITSQGRQNTGADVAQSAQYQGTTYATQVANLAAAKFAEAVNPVLADAIAGLKSVIIEALRNPPVGAQSAE